MPGAPRAPAILAPARPPLSFDALRKLASDTIARLNALGIGRNDRVAIVLPNGPEMAAAFIAIAAGATTAPLNPVYRAEEFEFYLTDLRARALVLDAAGNEAAEAVAEEARRSGPAAGGGCRTRRPELSASPAMPIGGERRRTGPAAARDIALVLHTSGTTSRPKIVPLSGANVAASAKNIRETLALTPSDRCLNIMPLFHIHGLIAAVTASLSAGASVVATPGFNALKFFQWLDQEKPTWYTAVPTMHQAILARAPRNAGERRARTPPLHPLLVIVAAAASDGGVGGLVPLPGDRVLRHDRGDASDGVEPAPAGARARPEASARPPGRRWRSWRRTASLLAPDEIGEIVIRGPNVTAGYEANPKANAEAFAHGWFHTGDQGTMDAEGYIRITGRLKEIINRGGEKISPREVDEVLMDHPAVAQVVTFAMPHEKLGEDVAAAIVLREGLQASEREIREFCAGRLADFKVPRKLVFLEEIPKGATGKLQRIGLAEKLGLTG